MLGLALCLASLASGTLAQDGETHEPPPEAMQYFEAGRAHYEAGRYQEASESLEQALTLDPESETLIFNLARIYELLGDLDRAISFGERYRVMVAENPEEINRADATLRRLEGAREWLALRESGQVPELRGLAPRVIVRDRGVVDTAFWAVLSAGAGLLAGGAVLGGFAISRQNQANDILAASDADQAERENLREKADGLALGADVMLIAGGATVTAALLLYLLRVRTYERDVDEVATSNTPRLGINADTQAAGIRLEGTF